MQPRAGHNIRPRTRIWEISLSLPLSKKKRLELNERTGKAKSTGLAGSSPALKSTLAPQCLRLHRGLPSTWWTQQPL